jgi:hypothetical protein
LFVEKEKGKTVEVDSYIPDMVTRLVQRVNNASFERVVLFGFSDNMKWLFRVLSLRNVKLSLCDWRDEFVGYDCGGEVVTHIKDIRNAASSILIVICPEVIADLKSGVRFLIENKLDDFPVIYDRGIPHDPFDQEEPFSSIKRRAKERAVSMISDQQLFDLAQFVRATKDVAGDVVEFGSLHGGSGAVIVEAVRVYNQNNKKVYLFDSFEGIPKSKYGLDYRWNGSFSNNSFAEVKNAFSDCKNVEVIKGNILLTYRQIEQSISFCYLASDTLESGVALLEFFWPKLNSGGIMAICDYGSYPNCIPLTVYTDMFFENRSDAIIFHTNRVGFFAVKK